MERERSGERESKGTLGKERRGDDVERGVYIYTHTRIYI